MTDTGLAKSTSPAKLYLIDGTYELFRAYYALPSRQAPDGREVGAIGGLIASTLALLRQPELTHVAAATDHVIESFRNQLFAGYKTGDGMPPDLWAQFPLAEEAFRAMGIALWPMIEFEADDALATAASRFQADVDEVVILSPDKDLMQCVVGDHVVTYDRVRDIRYDEAKVLEKFGVAPTSIPDLLALVGDTADGIPGIPGWGLKSAAAILSAYGTIDRIPTDPTTWSVSIRGSQRLARTLSDRRTDAGLYRRLAVLRTDVPLSEGLADLAWRGVPQAAYTDFCERCGLDALRERPHRWLA